MNKISKSESEWREQLSESQFQVCRLKGTERPFTGAYYRNTTPGVYHCICCDAALFDTDTQFDAGCGWPTYYQPVRPEVVEEHEDFSHGMHRIEVTCAQYARFDPDHFNAASRPTADTAAMGSSAAVGGS